MSDDINYDYAQAIAKQEVASQNILSRNSFTITLPYDGSMYEFITTNLAGSLAFSTPVEAAAQGSVWERTLEPAVPIKSLAANTATTIVAPTPQTGAIWRITAHYFLYT